ncbi:MAG: ShlB/FhaC/HecB family hemolysin secretion/activation protein [Halioglobus sp.]
MHLIKSLVGISSICFFSTVALAQQSGDGAAALQQLQRIQQEQQAEQQRQFEQDRKSSKPAVKLQMPVEKSREVEAGGICRDIKDVHLRGVTLIKQKALQPILARYGNRCLNISEIESLMAEVSGVYILEGYIASRVYLAEQDLSDGILVLLVIEGELEGVEILDGDADSISLFNVFPGEIGEPLNLRDIEQAVDQINRLQSNYVSMQVAPGERSGGSLLVFENEARKPWRVTPTYDNEGSPTTGKDQAGVSLSVDNALGWNDFLIATYRQTTPYDSGERGSKLASMTYVVPFGYSTLAINGSRSDYASPLDLPSGNKAYSSGKSENISVRLDRTVFRDRDSRWNLALAIANKDSKNYIDRVLLDGSSRVLTVVDVDSAYTMPLMGGVITLNAGYALGVNWFGALEDPGSLPDFAPHAQFGKWKYGASYQRGLSLFNQPLFFSSYLNGQYADDVLYGSEQILIGGIYTVRGFSKETLSGDHGFYWRNDLSMTMGLPTIADIPFSMRPYLGIDYGLVTSINDNVPDGALSGMAIGAGFTLGSFFVDVSGSHSLKRQSGMKSEGLLTFIRMNFKF